MKDIIVPAGLDSGASRNFVNPQIVKECGWKLEHIDPLIVHLVYKSQVVSNASCSPLVTIGGLQIVQQFRVIDCAFSVVLGMPFLREINPRIDWTAKVVCVHHNSRWLSLPTYQVL